jgi:hypothetical protein
MERDSVNFPSAVRDQCVTSLSPVCDQRVDRWSVVSEFANSVM